MSIAKKEYTYKVYIDNQASLKRLTNPSDQPGQIQYLRVLRAYREIKAKGASISFHWVLSHMDILSNELADSLVKESTIESPESEEVSLAYLKSKLRSLSIESWE
jgi:ribonuclease HI